MMDLNVELWKNNIAKNPGILNDRAGLWRNYQSIN